MEWAEQGYWKIYEHPATQAQYLGIGAATPDGTPPLNQVVGYHGESQESVNYADHIIYFCKDIDSNKENKAITFDGFMRHKIDIVIASIPQHIEPYKKLCELHPNKPKLIYQVGNAWNIPNNSVRNVMSSAIIPNIPIQINYVQYHQEFDRSVFRPHNESRPEAIHINDDVDLCVSPAAFISSFVNCFSVADYMRHDWQLYEDVERLMPQWVFNCFGGQCRDGAAHGNQQVADRMRDSRFIWHTKSGGDGYGHIIYNAAAVGRPLIVKKEYYAGKLGTELMVDGETCITIDGLSAQDVVEKINHYNDEDLYAALCRNTYENFKHLVDFDKEEQKMRTFLTNLI